MKSFLATFIGLIGAFVVIMVLEILGHMLFPPPAADLIAENLDEYLHLIPTGAYVSVIVAHGVGLLAGLLIARSIDKATIYSLYLIAGFLLLGTIANLAQISHPTWFAIADVGVVLAVGVLIIYKTHTQRAQN